MFMTTYKRALEVILKKPIMLWGLSLLLAIVSAIGSMVTFAIPVVSIAVSYLFACGSAKLYMDGLKGKEVNSKQLFYAFNRNCVKTAGAMAWRDLWTVIWALFLVVGFVVGALLMALFAKVGFLAVLFYLACVGFAAVVVISKVYSYRFVPYIIVSHPEISAFDALKISMKMTKGKRGQMFLADFLWGILLSIAMLLLSVLSSIKIIGVLFLIALIALVIFAMLFSNIFVGLYQAAFFNEEEVAQYIEAPESAE